jgi:hypothetical protein
VPQALAARYGLTAGTERKCSRGLWTKLSLDVTKSGQEPESGLKTAMFSGRAVYILGSLQLGA